MQYKVKRVEGLPTKWRQLPQIPGIEFRKIHN